MKTGEKTWQALSTQIFASCFGVKNKAESSKLLNRLEKKAFKFGVQLESSVFSHETPDKFANFASKQLGSHLKIIKIPGILLLKTGEILKFYHFVRSGNPSVHFFKCQGMAQEEFGDWLRDWATSH